MTATLALATSIAGLTSGSQGLSNLVIGIQEGVAKLGKMFGDVWANVKEIAEEKIEDMEEKLDGIKEFFSPLIKAAKALWEMLKEGWADFTTTTEEGLVSLGKKWGDFRTDIEDKLGGLREWLAGIPSAFMDEIEKIGDGISSWVEKWRGKLGDIRDDLRDKIQPHLDKMIQPFRDIWNMIQKIKNDIAGRIGKIVDFVVGKPNTAETTVGTAVNGGVTQNFSMNVSASGITDRSDKRQLAKDIGDMIQQETARSLGGTTVGR